MLRFTGNLASALLATTFALVLSVLTAAASPAAWWGEWPHTDFSKHSVPLAKIKSGGPPKDGIPAIDQPRFERLTNGAASGWSSHLADTEPVISLAIDGHARAYPLRILIWHEIVNDTVGDMPVVVTYCPLCNASLVFRRILDGRILDFGTTGKLYNSDLVMYDRQTESWWQQFTGEAIVGAITGRQLKLIPSRVESFARFKQRFPDGMVLIPTNPRSRAYGTNPYAGYDAKGQIPFLYDGALPEGIEPMERVVAVETAPNHYEAWSLALLRQKGIIETGNLVIKWQPGQVSALDKNIISAGRDVGNVMVQRRVNGSLIDVSYDEPFAFAFHAFRPNSPIHKDTSQSDRD